MFPYDSIDTSFVDCRKVWESGHASELMAKTYKEGFLYRKSLGLNYNRPHRDATTRLFLDTADEVGWMLEPEYHWAWGNGAPSAENLEKYGFGQYTEWVKENRNHPSVIVWSAENEYLLMKVYHAPQYAAAACKLLKNANSFLKKLDPTRPIIFEGDGELSGRLYNDDGTMGPTDATCLALRLNNLNWPGLNSQYILLAGQF